MSLRLIRQKRIHPKYTDEIWETTALLFSYYTINKTIWQLFGRNLVQILL